MKSAVVGMRVKMLVPGEESGWDEDRGRPEHVSPDTKVTGRLARIGKQRPDGTRQVQIYSEGRDGDIVATWGWLHNCERA